VASRIAAGEVIERPSSVVKELVENALDAAARRITVELRGGGLDEIVVTDDGHGIEVDDLPLAFVRHATSKLAHEDDLMRVGTLGFRGEALASIAAVADVDLLTRTSASPHAWHVAVRSGHADAPVPATRTVGTTITARALFAELPARRKFLRSRAAETGQVTQLIGALALAFPSVALTLTAEGRRVLETAGDGDLVATIIAVHGRATTGYLIPIFEDTDERAPTVVRGCLGWGEATLPTRAGITLLVNGRWVQSRSLTFAVDEAYRSLIQVGQHPIVVLDITVPPHEVDVNVHPRKAEVRLLHERAVFAAVQRTIRRTLAGVGGPRPSSLLDGDSERDGWPADGGPANGQGAGAWTRGLTVLGQAGGTYIIAEGAAGLYLVDQHAAHERVLAEQLRAAWDGPTGQQALLEPAVIEVAPRAIGALRERLPEIAATGYDVEPFGDGALIVRAVPAALADRDPLRTLRDTIEALADEAPADDWCARLAELVACHTAVRAGDHLSTEEMAALLDQLGEADLCQACAHGRPTAILLSHTQLAREFGRLY